MRKSKYTESQIAFALNQAETGIPVSEVTRKMGVTEQTFYRWKKKYGGLGATELRRLRQLEERLVGARLDDERAWSIESEDLTALSPIDDIRGTADYRRQAALVLVRRLLDELRS